MNACDKYCYSNKKNKYNASYGSTSTVFDNIKSKFNSVHFNELSNVDYKRRRNYSIYDMARKRKLSLLNPSFIPRLSRWGKGIVDNSLSPETSPRSVAELYDRRTYMGRGAYSTDKLWKSYRTKDFKAFNERKDSVASITRLVGDIVDGFKRNEYRARISFVANKVGEDYGPGHTFGMKINHYDQKIEVYDQNYDRMYVNNNVPNYNRIINEVMKKFPTYTLFFPKLNLDQSSDTYKQWKKKYTSKGGEGSCVYFFDNFCQYRI